MQQTNMSFARAQVIGTALFAAAVALVLLAYGAFWDFDNVRDVSGAAFGERWYIAFPIFLASIVVHELLHGVGCLIAGIRWSDVKFGVHWRLLTPYATTEVTMSAAQYRLVAALPGVVLGVLPAAVGIATGSAVITVFGAFLLGAASGDALVLWSLRKVPGDARVRDCKDAIGCEVL